MQQLTEPNDLLHFFYKYGVQEVPVSKEGDITGKLVKSSVVRYLSRSENFESNIVATIDRLMEPVGESFFDELKQALKDGSIKGIPIVRETGEIDQVVTPGVLDAREEANEYIDESRKREIYENFLGEIPFALALFRDGEAVFKNQRWESLPGDGDCETLHWSEGEYSLKLRLPGAVKQLLDGFDSLRSDGSIEFRSLVERVESRLLEKAHETSDSISEAAERLNLPRQTFNYRWEKQREETDDDA